MAIGERREVNNNKQINTIDREKVCPFLLRVFWQLGSHNRSDAYSGMPERTPPNELQIYTWPDATLGELRELIQDVNNDAQKRNSRLSFSFVYPDRRGRNIMRNVGIVSNRRKGDDDEKTLRSLGFVIGDYLDVAIHT